jgi:hypothetical protein
MFDLPLLRRNPAAKRNSPWLFAPSEQVYPVEAALSSFASQKLKTSGQQARLGIAPRRGIRLVFAFSAVFLAAFAAKGFLHSENRRPLTAKNAEKTDSDITTHAPLEMAGGMA